MSLLGKTANKVMLFAAVVGATGIVAGASVLAQSQQSINGSNGRGNSYAANQCKNGGWEDLGYENQGQCVSDMVKGNISNDTSVDVSNSTSQSAQSGNASVRNNTSGGSATSGSVSNSSSSSSSVQVTN